MAPSNIPNAANAQLEAELLRLTSVLFNDIKELRHKQEVLEGRVDDVEGEVEDQVEATGGEYPEGEDQVEFARSLALY